MRIIAALALTFVVLSNAEAAPLIYKIANVCGFDMAQYCPKIPAKRLRDLKACLAKHERELLPQCQDHYKEAN